MVWLKRAYRKKKCIKGAKIPKEQLLTWKSALFQERVMLRADNRRMRSLLSEAQRSLITLLMVLLWLLWFQEWRWGWQCARRLFSGTYQLNEAIIHVISSAAAPFSHTLKFNLSAKGRGYCTDSNLKLANAHNKLSCLNCHFCVYAFITVSSCEVTRLKPL